MYKCYNKVNLIWSSNIDTTCKAYMKGKAGNVYKLLSVSAKQTTSPLSEKASLWFSGINLLQCGRCAKPTAAETERHSVSLFWSVPPTCSRQEGTTTTTTAQNNVAHKPHNNTCFCNTEHLELLDSGLSSALHFRAQWSYKVVPTLADRDTPKVIQKPPQ